MTEREHGFERPDDGSSLQSYVRRFQELRVNHVNGRPSPHKIVMLLAVMQLFENERIRENRLEFSGELLEIYRSFFRVVATESDHPNPYFPFFHLQGSWNTRFWYAIPRPGRELRVSAMRSARSMSDVDDNIAFVRLEADLFELFSERESRRVLWHALVEHWFPDFEQHLSEVSGQQTRISSYAQELRESAESGLGVEAPIRRRGEPDSTRDPAFARVVREAYDSRCAATGWRVILPDGSAMVEAAHLIPFSVSGDDDPRNGIALAPTYHWALDRGIIAPGPDLKWHVSRIFDRRNRDYADLLDLDRSDILLPSNEKYWPRSDSLEWRVERLLRR